MNSPLDRPVWASLLHAPQLAEGRDLARRYRRDVNLFASARDDDSASLAALADLVGAGESVYLAQVPPVQVPPGLQIVRSAQGVQMLAMQPVTPERGEEAVLALGDADAPEMLALAQLTEPGPFLPRTHTMGRFVGVRIGGRLAAMAGERMHFAGATEVSGVCTHPDFRGRGLARQLSSVVAHAIQQRGEQAFLHAWTTNHAAIALYESLGFQTRTEVQVAVLAR
ncbi:MULTISPECIES: GNAT family N-acetyltransferase [unclassified Acidovorax]|uniref:GNAT family N-acetyltransferase n=1 Tax=unclassified Acidovorax TaxID=2684926 RepID=UPI00070CE1B9|nr:GNAT family N-acetyltransferase [Acidovorax sp. Root219]KRC24203.1 GNAT family acetyltransferase [Acidovorax sp. Root219]